MQLHAAPQLLGQALFQQNNSCIKNFSLALMKEAEALQRCHNHVRQRAT
jgi:hypothetical protein